MRPADRTAILRAFTRMGLRETEGASLLPRRPKDERLPTRFAMEASAEHRAFVALQQAPNQSPMGKTAPPPAASQQRDCTSTPSARSTSRCVDNPQNRN